MKLFRATKNNIWKPLFLLSIALLAFTFYPISVFACSSHTNNSFLDDLTAPPQNPSSDAALIKAAATKLNKLDVLGPYFWRDNWTDKKNAKAQKKHLRKRAKKYGRRIHIVEHARFQTRCPSFPLRLGEKRVRVQLQYYDLINPRIENGHMTIHSVQTYYLLLEGKIEAKLLTNLARILEINNEDDVNDIDGKPKKKTKRERKAKRQLRNPQFD